MINKFQYKFIKKEYDDDSDDDDDDGNDNDNANLIKLVNLYKKKNCY